MHILQGGRHPLGPTLLAIFCPFQTSELSHSEVHILGSRKILARSFNYRPAHSQVCLNDIGMFFDALKTRRTGKRRKRVGVDIDDHIFYLLFLRESRELQTRTNAFGHAAQ